MQEQSLLFYLVQTNFVGLAIVLYLYIFLLTGTTLNKMEKRIFLTAVVIVNILIIADCTDYWCSTFEHPVVLRYITSAAGYALRPAAIAAMVFITFRYSKTKWLWLLVPLFLNGIIAFSSIFTKAMFYFDEQNEFHRGFLGFLPFVVSAFYMVLLLMASVRKYRLGNQKEAAVVVLIAVMAIISTGMESIFKFKFMINGVGGISLIFYFAFLNTQTYKRDALTNALNRHAFYVDSTRLTRYPMMIVSIDLNNLKMINDNLGHEEGDKAITTVSECIFKYLPSNYNFYRMGGDEFLLLCLKASVRQIEKMMGNICRDVEKAGYEIAWGYAEYKPGMNFEEVYKLSDEKMYDDKMQRKAKGTTKNIQINEV